MSDEKNEYLTTCTCIFLLSVLIREAVATTPRALDQAATSDSHPFLWRSDCKSDSWDETPLLDLKFFKTCTMIELCGRNLSVTRSSNRRSARDELAIPHELAGKESFVVTKSTLETTAATSKARQLSTCVGSRAAKQDRMCISVLNWTSQQAILGALPPKPIVLCLCKLQTTRRATCN